MSSFFGTLATCVILLGSATAAPLLGRSAAVGSTSTATPASVSQSTIEASLVRPAQFSRVAYCSTPSVTSWNCGGSCAALGSNVKVLQSGGDDGLIPMYFIAHDVDTDSIVVAHQGTEPTNILSVLNDVKLLLTDLNSTRFTSIGGLGIQVHEGFQETFERTADGVLSGVQSALSSTGAKKVVVTGHSLGAAIATLDSMMLKQVLDPSITVTTTVFGLPRVGNQAWADFVDQQLGSSLIHVTNQHDPVPILPPRFLAYQHPAGEIHINSVDSTGAATSIVSCPGQENEHCSEGNSLLDPNILNHLGPYFDDISFGDFACSA
ncbi:alpha/beta-hydrolase [Mycena floridula]|nr:alpha/beta-hydrolase [Mycena floridula]